MILHCRLSRMFSTKQLARTLLSGLLALLCATSSTAAQVTQPEPIRPEYLEWSSPPDNPLVQGAWMIGAERAPGAYAFRVTMLKGGRIPPHTHPDTRHSTVLSGTLYVGFGHVSDDSRLVAVPEGAAYVVPAGVPHYLYAKDGDVIYQEGGIGPTATVPVK